MKQHWMDLARVMALVAALAVSNVGWGSFAARRLRLGRANESDLVMLGWIGWALVLLLLQLLHFFVPLTAVTVTPLYFVGAALAVQPTRARLRGLPAEGSRRVGLWIAIGGFSALAGAAFVASRAMLAPQVYDFGLYHHSAMQWANAHPAVPGLGNIHPRLAFNQSSLLWVASLNLHPFFGHGRVVAMTYFSLLGALTLVAPFLRRRDPVDEVAHGVALDRGAAILLAPFMVYLVVYLPGFSSATPDHVGTFLQIGIFLVLCRALESWKAAGKADAEMQVLAVLAATAVTVKMNSGAFAAACLALASAHAWRGGRLRRAAATLWLPFVVLATWMGRGVVLSGMPLFPSTLGRLPVDWAVPREVAIDTANWAYSWARRPGVHWREVLGGWDWVGPWLESAWGRLVEIVGPTVLLVGLTALATIFALRGSRLSDRRDAWLLAPPLAGVLFWLLSAPDPRFLGAQSWLLVVAVALLLLAQVLDAGGPRAAKATLAVLVALVAVPFAVEIAKHGLRPRVSTAGIHEVQRVRVRAVHNAQGVRYFVPRRGDQCWAGPLLCVPRQRPFLLRDPTSVRAGFRPPTSAEP